MLSIWPPTTTLLFLDGRTSVFVKFVFQGSEIFFDFCVFIFPSLSSKSLVIFPWYNGFAVVWIVGLISSDVLLIKHELWTCHCMAMELSMFVSLECLVHIMVMSVFYCQNYSWWYVHVASYTRLHLTMFINPWGLDLITLDLKHVYFTGKITRAVNSNNVYEWFIFIWVISFLIYEKRMTG